MESETETKPCSRIGLVRWVERAATRLFCKLNDRVCLVHPDTLVSLKPPACHFHTLSNQHTCAPFPRCSGVACCPSWAGANAGGEDWQLPGRLGLENYKKGKSSLCGGKLQIPREPSRKRYVELVSPCYLPLAHTHFTGCIS